MSRVLPLLHQDMSERTESTRSAVRPSTPDTAPSSFKTRNPLRGIRPTKTTGSPFQCPSRNYVGGCAHELVSPAFQTREPVKCASARVRVRAGASRHAPCTTYPSRLGARIAARVLTEVRKPFRGRSLRSTLVLTPEASSARPASPSLFWWVVWVSSSFERGSITLAQTRARL